MTGGERANVKEARGNLGRRTQAGKPKGTLKTRKTGESRCYLNERGGNVFNCNKQGVGASST